MTTSIHLISLAVVSIGLGSCAQTFDFTEPVDGPVALVRFSVNSRASLNLIPRSSCVGRVSGAGVVVTDTLIGGASYNGRKLGIRGQGPAHFATSEVRVPADAPVTQRYKSEVDSGTTIYTCQYDFTWLPKAGNEYQVTVDHSTGGGQSCRLDITNLSKAEERVQFYRANSC